MRMQSISSPQGYITLTTPLSCSKISGTFGLLGIFLNCGSELPVGTRAINLPPRNAAGMKAFKKTSSGWTNFSLKTGVKPDPSSPLTLVLGTDPKSWTITSFSLGPWAR